MYLAQASPQLIFIVLIMEKSLAILCTVMFGVGMFGGLAIGSIRTKAKHIKTEYFIELRENSVVIESVDGYLYECPLDSLPVVLLKDNL